MRRPITDEALAPLAERYGDTWKIWRSNPDGWYACASRRRGLSWVRMPDGSRRDLPATLVEESAEELAEALAVADEVVRSACATAIAEMS